eukprot:Pgem_evm1s227
MNFISKFFSATTVALLVTNVISHGTLKVPRGSQKRNGPMKTEFCNDIANGMKQNYGHHPGVDMAGFARDFGASQYKGDLHNLYKAKNINRNEFEMRTNHNEQTAPRKVKWQNNNDDNFIVDHHGPCALYVEKGNSIKMIFHHDNCVKRYRRSDIDTPNLPEVCGSDGCYLKFYWLVTGVNSGIPTGQVQYYYAAAKLKGVGSGQVSGGQVSLVSPVSQVGPSNSKDACGCGPNQGWSQHAGRCTFNSVTEGNDECTGTHGKCI